MSDEEGLRIGYQKFRKKIFWSSIGWLAITIFMVVTAAALARFAVLQNDVKLMTVAAVEFLIAVAFPVRFLFKVLRKGPALETAWRERVRLTMQNQDQSAKLAIRGTIPRRDSFWLPKAMFLAIGVTAAYQFHNLSLLTQILPVLGAVALVMKSIDDSCLMIEQNILKRQPKFFKFLAKSVRLADIRGYRLSGLTRDNKLQYIEFVDRFGISQIKINRQDTQTDELQTWARERLVEQLPEDYRRLSTWPKPFKL